MLELNNALELILKGIEGKLTELDFKVEYPEGVRPPELPVSTVGKKSVIMYRGEKGRVRMELDGDKLALFCARADESDTPDDDMRRVSLSLLDLETFNEKDLKYIYEEYNETFDKTFSGKSQHRQKAVLWLTMQTLWAAVSPLSIPNFAMSTKTTLTLTANFLQKTSS